MNKHPNTKFCKECRRIVGKKPHQCSDAWNKGTKGVMKSWNKGKKLHYPVWNKGKKLTKEQKSKLNLSGLEKGRGWNKGIPATWMIGSKRLVGRKFTSEHRQHISEGLKGHIGHMRGKKHSEETKRKMSESQKGEKSYLWKGGITPINAKIRNSLEYRLWREAVFKRDDYTCQECGQWGGGLHADHIKPFAYYQELRFKLDNGRTLCVDCHKKTPSYLNRWYSPIELSTTASVQPLQQPQQMQQQPNAMAVK